MQYSMKFFIYILLILSFSANAAAPEDINTNQRAWFDAVDLNGDGDYTDNPNTNSEVSEWFDKSGSGNNVSGAGSRRPSYAPDTLGAQRHGIRFNGSSNSLTDTDDIWSGAVGSSESFIALTTDVIKSSFAFLSYGSGNRRVGVHIPWSNSKTYFDQGICCGAPTRLSGVIPISLGEQYFWHFIGVPTLQSVLQDGKSYLSDPGASIYDVMPDSIFSIGGGSTFNFHNGRIFEALFYQTELNKAQRSIINNYLSAKWNKAFASSPTYTDVYSGDEVAKGDYDFFVGGIGRSNGVQTVGTSQGLTITDNSFLSADGKYILAGVDYLTTNPITGVSSSDMPAGYLDRSNRSWYIDRTGDDGLVSLSFDASVIGLGVDNGAEYGLFHRTGTSGRFTSVATTTMSGGVIAFSHLPDDGVYTVGKKGIANISLMKTNQTTKDPVNDLNNPKAIPGSIIDYTLTVKNMGNLGPDTDTTLIKDILQGQLSLFTGDLDGNGSPFVFTDNSCPPDTATTTSNLSLVYPDDVVFRNAAGDVVTPTMDYDTSIRSFEITLSGLMNINYQSDVPCFTIKYRTKLE